ncbi:hypothetical protein AWB78_08051 [Caballeronia calidae]|uniref:Uncharacterized protein n=1 Tax=Caballeronia calidae TaxID=1777139 RepID=A0A158EHL8_9BURK|nr:hypothetical protein AWB78_08051 [Caballeronia calidae]
MRLAVCADTSLLWHAFSPLALPVGIASPIVVPCSSRSRDPARANTSHSWRISATSTAFLANASSPRSAASMHSGPAGATRFTMDDGGRWWTTGKPTLEEGTGDVAFAPARPVGDTWMLSALWQQLGMAEAFRRVLRPSAVRRRASAARDGVQPAVRSEVEGGHRALARERAGAGCTSPSRSRINGGCARWTPWSSMPTRWTRHSRACCDR